MKLRYPVTPFTVTQGFGANVEYYKQIGLGNGHNGLDLMTYHGQPVYAAHDGYATYQVDSTAGHHVIVQGNGIRTVYLHFCDPYKEPKYKSPMDNFLQNPVKAGDLLGYSDSTGFSTGTHLHFGVKLTNERGETLNSDNGFGGAIDPMPFFQDKYIFTKDLSTGNIGAEVLKLQQRLVDEGYASFTPIGVFGPRTKIAVKEFQGEHGLPQTGYVGFLTRTELNR